MKTFRTAFLGAAAAAFLLASPAISQTGFRTLYNFTGVIPTGLVQANGVLYGAFDGPSPAGSDCGAVFELRPPATSGGEWTETTLYSFAETGDGCHPDGGPVPAPNGELYGLTLEGGAYGFGALYKLQPPASAGGAWTESVLYSFGIFPWGNLVAGPGGSFYVLTDGGGAYGWGALLQLRPPASGGSWTGTQIFSFPQGAQPSSLITGPGSTLYGTAFYYGLPGLVYQLTPPATPGGAWTETVLYNLTIAEGSYANSLILASNGTLYGTTYGDSAYGSGPGTVFQLTPPGSAGGTWTYSMVKNFGGNHPNLPLILRDGHLFGTIATPQGGAVYELTPSSPGSPWNVTFPHNFTNAQVPDALLISEKGVIYGTTETFYPQPPTGTVFQIAPE
ncbi:MAG TPA: choice-of-anchor tandem repeat GloVer-containing protein [Candidatus Acidoferrum sp.]|nr:choice-of-anchor tandem repeat GloVer-containing protein [Candidatus Acidoferrum sp.]